MLAGRAGASVQHGGRAGGDGSLPRATARRRHGWITSANPVPWFWPLLAWLENQGSQSNSLLQHVTKLQVRTSLKYPHLQVHKQRDRLPIQS